MENQDYISQLEIEKFLKALVIPRPIALVTSLSLDGIVNVAPFSYFNIVCTAPALISISIAKRNGTRKDTARNILQKQEFVVNICPTHFDEVMNLVSRNYPPEISEAEIAKLSLIPSSKITTPRIVGTFAQLECMLQQVVEVGEESIELIIGKVINIHVSKQILDDKGDVNHKTFKPIARSIGNTYFHQ